MMLHYFNSNIYSKYNINKNRSSTTIIKPMSSYIIIVDYISTVICALCCHIGLLHWLFHYFGWQRPPSNVNPKLKPDQPSILLKDILRCVYLSISCRVFYMLRWELQSCWWRNFCLSLSLAASSTSRYKPIPVSFTSWSMEFRLGWSLLSSSRSFLLIASNLCPLFSSSTTF